MSGLQEAVTLSHKTDTRMKQVVDYTHMIYCDWPHSCNNLRFHSPGVKLWKTEWLLARHWRVPANQMHGHTHQYAGSLVSGDEQYIGRPMSG